MIHPYWSIANFSAFWMCCVFLIHTYFYFPAYYLTKFVLHGSFKGFGLLFFMQNWRFLWILKLYNILAENWKTAPTNFSSLTFFATLDTLFSVFTHLVKSLWVRVSRQGAEGASYLQGKECWWTCWEMNSEPSELEGGRGARAQSYIVWTTLYVYLWCNPNFSDLPPSLQLCQAGWCQGSVTFMVLLSFYEIEHILCTSSKV